MSYAPLLKEVESSLKKMSPSQTKGPHYTRLHISVPKLRLVKKKDTFFFKMSRTEKIKILDYIWRNTKYFECMNLALYHYQHLTLSRTEFLKIKLWINRCHCWEHSDDLSKIYAQVLEENPQWILPTLLNWNKSRNLWKKRQSLVSLLEYSSKRKKTLPFKQLASFVKPLLEDKEYYVQKGLGWTLREIFNLHPKQTLKFINENLNKISSLAYSAATEKIDEKTKASLNKKRKLLRKN